MSKARNWGLLSTVGIVVAFVLTPAGLGQTILGSEHDFSGSGWSGGQICVTCHTPHNADTTVANAPLWNHALTTATFTPYSSATLDASVGQPNGISKLCLSCHDGTVAIDSFGGTTGSTIISGGARIGTDLSNDHPISFAYSAALATTDGGLYDPTATASGLGGTITADLLNAGQLECSSCHDVHNSYGNNHLLVKSNAGSALCLTCHDK
jgi:predicted CXXCH cytochrome family protein